MSKQVSTPDLSDDHPDAVQALRVTPLKTEKLGVGQQQIPLHIGGVNIRPRRLDLRGQ